MNAGVYKITNILNNKIYIGSSKNLRSRQKRHFLNLSKNKHENPFLQNDWNKCGGTNFIFEIILETDCEEILLNLEQSYLDEFWDNKQNCYNISKNSTAPMKGRHHSKENVEKIRKRMIGNTFSKNLKLSKKHKEKISHSMIGSKNHFFGRRHSLETKMSISKALTGYKSISNEKRKITFTVISPQGEIFTHTGLSEFCRIHKLNCGQFCEMINGKRKICKGWRLVKWL